MPIFFDIELALTNQIEREDNMSVKKKKKHSTLSWVAEFAGQKKANYILSVMFAFCKVLCGIMPYIYLADIVKKLI